MLKYIILNTKGQKMKNIIRLLLALFAVFALNACGAAGNALTGNTDLKSVDINNLQDGYVINGYNNANQDIQLIYCRNTYSYYRGNKTFKGRFSIANGGIKLDMYDNDGGSYFIQTDGYLYVGKYYSINYVSDEISITSIIAGGC